jgi:pimeloyl-ACP methyl ester carboxylesterase
MLLDLLHKIVRRRFHSLGFQSHFLETRFGRLHYLLRDHAESPGTLLLIHGLGTSSSTWIKVLPLLQEKYRIAALDLPGFGFSALERNRTHCTLEEHLEALGIFADAVGHAPVILLGHSFGGWISGFHASRHPHGVRHLVLVDTAGIHYRGAEKLRESFTLNSVQDTRRLLNDLWYRYPWYFKPFAGAIFRELRHRGMNELVASIDAESFLVEELGRFSMPVSIIWGREDKVILPESVGVLVKFVPHARVSLIDQCGHVPQLERPAEFAALVREILEKNDDGLA